MKSNIFNILFQDDDILVVEKLQPFLSQRSDEGGSEAFFEFIGRSLGKKVYPVHRLDRDVLGVMVFTYSAEACEELSKQFRERNIEKAYRAWVVGSPWPAKAELQHYLLKNKKNNHVTVYTRPTPGAKEARLDYEVLQTDGQKSLLKIDLHTGRTHQIRAQLAKIGHPIIGDSRYSHRKAKAHKQESYLNTPIQLRSVQLVFEHPKTGERLRFHRENGLKNFPFS